MKYEVRFITRNTIIVNNATSKEQAEKLAQERFMNECEVAWDECEAVAVEPTVFEQFAKFFLDRGMTEEDVAYFDRIAIKEAFDALTDDYTVDELHEMGCEHMLDCIESEPDELLEFYAVKRMEKDSSFRLRCYELYYRLRKANEEDGVKFPRMMM